MELNTKVNGRMIYKMGMELKPGQTIQNMRVIIKQERNMEKEPMSGVMDLNI